MEDQRSNAIYYRTIKGGKNGAPKDSLGAIYWIIDTGKIELKFQPTSKMGLNSVHETKYLLLSQSTTILGKLRSQFTLVMLLLTEQE